METIETITLCILAVIGGIALIIVGLFELGKKVMKKPELPQDLFEDCRADLRQLQDWYFSNGQYKQTDKTATMLKELDGLWAEYDMKQEGKGNDAHSI